MKLKRRINTFTPDRMFVSDLHIQERKDIGRINPITNLNSRLEDGLNILSQIRDVQQQYHIPVIWFLGDWFEFKDRIPNHVLIEFGISFNNIADQSEMIYSLLGNHDFQWKEYPTIKLFDKENVKIIDKPSVIVDNKMIVGCLPYRRKWKDFEEDWKTLHQSKALDIVIMHQDIPGVSYDSGFVSQGSFNLPTLPGVIYLAGHIHTPQKLGQIQFLGSPYPDEFGSNEGERFIWLLESSTKEIRPYQLHYREFIDVEFLSDIHTKDLENQYVRIVGEVTNSQERHELQELKTNLEKVAQAVVVKVKQLSTKTERENNVPVFANDKDAITSYVNSNLNPNGNLNAETAIIIGLELHEVQDTKTEGFLNPSEG